MLVHFPRLRVRSWILALFACLLLWAVLPYDNGIVLFTRWHFNTVSEILRENDRWLRQPPAFPVDMDDVGMVVKTGYSTKERLVAWLKAFGDSRNTSNVVLVGDYSTVPGTHFNHSGQEMLVHNAIAWMIESGALSSSRPDAPRLQYYSNMTTAISRGDTDLAHTIGKTHGWELDILKHISGLQIGYKLMPQKKWYILMDDDTYVLNASLEVILGHLDPSIPHYMGNAVGDYKGRFAHGGSAVVLSQGAMDRIFRQNADIVSAAHMESLDSQWGDKLIATTAMKTGIYLEERYNRHFNGESPRMTKIRRDRICVPIVSFHKMSAPQMLDVGQMFQGNSKIVSWIDLWDIYNSPALHQFVAKPIRANWDHVGKLDEDTMTTMNVNTEQACLDVCHRHGRKCLAWVWEGTKNICHISPWMIVGEAAEGKSSGVNALLALKLLRACNR